MDDIPREVRDWIIGELRAKWKPIKNPRIVVFVNTDLERFVCERKYFEQNFQGLEAAQYFVIFGQSVCEWASTESELKSKVQHWSAEQIVWEAPTVHESMDGKERLFMQKGLKLVCRPLTAEERAQLQAPPSGC